MEKKDYYQPECHCIQLNLDGKSVLCASNPDGNAGTFEENVWSVTGIE